MLAKKGITVNCIATGGIHNIYGLDKDFDLARQVPFGRGNTLKNIGKAVSFLIDEAGGAITGKVLIYHNGKMTTG
jgi:3-oxoacyl-[acyl-carrier protein] reductase